MRRARRIKTINPHNAELLRFRLIKDRDKLSSEIDKNEKLLDAAARDRKRLAQWQRRALPPDKDLARSLYQNWLRSLAARTNLRGTTLVAKGASDASVRRDQQFTRISFDLHAQAKLGDLVQFLYEFYSAGFLHQIRDMTIKPAPNGARELDVKVAIEALSLPTANAKDRLPDKPPQEAGHALHLAKLSDYQEPIAKRDFFGAYVAPRPINERPTPPSRTVDPADHTFVTGFTEVDGISKVWLWDRMRDKTWQLGTGESFSVGNVKGTVEVVHPEGDVLIEFGGQRRRLHKEDNLHGGVEIKDQPSKQTKEDDDSADLDPDEGN